MLKVTSEFGRLREAIVHRPGHELVRMTPSTRDYFLFDDLLYDDHAQQEHDWLTDLLQNHLGVKLHFFEQLLSESLAAAHDEERHALISQVCRLESECRPLSSARPALRCWCAGSKVMVGPSNARPEGDLRGRLPERQPPTALKCIHHESQA